MTDAFKVKTETELKGPSNEPKKKKKGFLEGFFEGVLIAASVIAVAVAGTLITVRLIYTECFVSGMSMFPTLNGPRTGQMFDPYSPNDGQRAGQLVDYGLYFKDRSKLESLNRFDIVCSYYPEDLKVTGDHTTPLSENLKSSASLKIKRVIGLPGETIWITTGSAGAGDVRDTRPMGKLYVSTDPELSNHDLATESVLSLIDAGLDISYVDQPLTQDDYNQALRQCPYRATESYNGGNPVTYNLRWTLGEDEYILLGDNRAGSYSKDSRSVGPISRYMMDGKVDMFIGLGKISQDEMNCRFKLTSLKITRV